MLFRLTADLIVVLHFLFVVFALLGGLFVLRYNRIIWLHIPTALWAAYVAVAGKICPLTPLENWLRRKGGFTAYDESFIEHYLTPILYPQGLTRGLQLSLGLFVLILNICLYTYIFMRKKRDGVFQNGSE